MNKKKGSDNSAARSRAKEGLQCAEEDKSGGEVKKNIAQMVAAWIEAV